MLGDVPSTHPSPVLFLSNIHTQPISKVRGLTSSDMKCVILYALLKKGIEVPKAQVEIPRYFTTISPFFHCPIIPNNRHFEKELTSES